MFDRESRRKLAERPAQFAGVPRFARELFLIVAGYVICAICSPAEVQASCGNYLFQHGKPVSVHASNGHLGVQTFPPFKFDDEQPGPNFPFCTGPNCSRRVPPLFPLGTAPLLRLQNIEQANISEMTAKLLFAVKRMDIPRSERGDFFEPEPFFRPPTVC